MHLCGSCGAENPVDNKFCGSCGAPMTPADAPFEVRKVVTVVFVDIADSTALGERLDPERLRIVMGSYFAAAKDVIERHGGTVEKFIGDAVMAVFGIPTLHEDDALRAVRAANELGPALATLNEKLTERFGVQIAIRVGVNTGQVMAEDSIDGHNFVTGDAVNVAARLQQVAPPDAVVLGPQTYSLVQHAVDAEQLDPLELKGKSENVDAYRLVDVKQGAESHIRRGQSALVGRQRQLRQLAQAFEAATEDGSCQLFTVLGTPGVGKSRLIEEFLNSVKDDATVTLGRCLPYGDGITLWPIAQAIRGLAGVAESDFADSAVEVLNQLTVGQSDVLAPGFGDDERDVAGIRSVLGLGTDAPSTDSIPVAIRHLFEHVARKRPLVLVFDDIHWAEAAFLDIIEHLTDWSRAPVLLICMARPDLLDTRPGWGGGKLNAAVALLEPLNQDQSRELLTNLTQDVVSDETRDRILSASEGNPLFVEEMAAMLLEGGSSANGADEVAIPASLQLLLAARLDQLALPERRAMARASVVGKAFERSAVAALTPDVDQDEIPTHLRGLARRDLIRIDPMDEDAYMFRHMLIRDAAYDSLPKQERAELHERFASWLESEVASLASGFEEIVGYHLEQAYQFGAELGSDRPDLAQRASDLLGRAGERARRRRDLTAAASLLLRAGQLRPGRDRDKCILLLGSASCLARSGHFDEMDEIIAAALAIADENDDELVRARADVIAIMTIRSDRLPIEESIAQLKRGIEVLERESDAKGLAEAWDEVASQNNYLGRHAEMMAAETNAIHFAREAADPVLELEIQVNQLLYGLWGLTTTSELEKGLEEMWPRKDENLSASLQAHQIRACCFSFRGMFEEARADVDAARAVIDEAGSRLWVAFGTTTQVTMVLARFDLEISLDRTREAYEILTELGEAGARGSVAGDLADLIIRSQGDLDEALELAREAIVLGGDDDVDALSKGLAVEAEIRALRGDQEALTFAKKAVDVIAATDYLWRAGQIYEQAARVHEALGDGEGAAAHLRLAIGCHDRKEDLWAASEAGKKLASFA
jgi:class 3 adenylate cyclase/tetratricopeptide (TPR) repeat protein